MNQRNGALDNPILVLKQILNGLMHIHSQGFLHLDLKPENIAISNHGEAKIMDFDLAEPIRRKSNHHSTVKMAKARTLSASKRNA